METLGTRIRKLRNDLGQLQTELVDKVNIKHGTKITSSMLSKWESDRDTPALDNVTILSEYFNVSLDYLITGKTDIYENFRNDLSLLELIKVLNNIPLYRDFILKATKLDSEQLALLILLIEQMLPKEQKLGDKNF